MDSLETTCFVYGLSIMTVVCIANHHIQSTPLNYRAQLKPVPTVSIALPIVSAQMVPAVYLPSLHTGIFQSLQRLPGHGLSASARVNFPFSH